MSERRTVKIVMIGDGAVGKTALCSTFVNNQFPQDYIPTVFDNFSRLQTVDGEQVTMSIWDTAGQEEYVCYFIFILFLLFIDYIGVLFID